VFQFFWSPSRPPHSLVRDGRGVRGFVRTYDDTDAVIGPVRITPPPSVRGFVRTYDDTDGGAAEQPTMFEDVDRDSGPSFGSENLKQVRNPTQSKMSLHGGYTLAVTGMTAFARANFEQAEHSGVGTVWPKAYSHRSLGQRPRTALSFGPFGRRPSSPCSSARVKMAFGQKTAVRISSWGVAPGYGEDGFRPRFRPAMRNFDRHALLARTDAMAERRGQSRTHRPATPPATVEIRVDIRTAILFSTGSSAHAHW